MCAVPRERRHHAAGNRLTAGDRRCQRLPHPCRRIDRRDRVMPAGLVSGGENPRINGASSFLDRAKVGVAGDALAERQRGSPAVSIDHLGWRSGSPLSTLAFGHRLRRLKALTEGSLTTAASDRMTARSGWARGKFCASFSAGAVYARIQTAVHRPRPNSRVTRGHFDQR
jgi:hypothetical protein